MPDSNDTLKEVQAHYQQWTEDRDKRMTRENGWDDVLDAYFGRLPEDWPYLSRVVDPRLRTTLIEKRARLTNAKLRGTLAPREGGDIVGARINNTLLDFQWDNAEEGGSMNGKWGQLDMDSRMFESGFALITWKYKTDDDGKVIFNGNEMKTLDPRDVGLISGTNIRDAKWCQVSEFKTMDELENENQVPGKPKYPGLQALKDSEIQDKKDNNYISRLKSIKGLENYIGEDRAFPVIEITTEYQEGKWITFAPRHNVILREIDNQYKHRKIPLVQLKYFPLSDDVRGESEVESVLSLWRAIQATLCGYLDSMNLHMRPPLKILENGVRMETIEYGPDAQWIMSNLDAVQEFQGSGEPLKYFQTTYSSLVAAFNTAMGDSSQGVGGVDPFNPDKTATEIKDTAQQRNARDQDNQNVLSDALKDMMSMWMSNNNQFLFADDEMHEYVMKIVGEKDFAFFKKVGLDQEVLSNQTTQLIADTVLAQDGDVSDLQMQELVNAGSVPKFPIIENPEETDEEKISLKPKMTIDDTGREAELILVPDDLNGVYDYIPDVKSMSIGAHDEMLAARKQATELLFNNQNVIKLLEAEGFRPNAKEILTEIFEDSGTRDGDRFFTEVGTPGQGVENTAGVPEALGQQGLPAAPPAAQPPQQVAQPPAV